MALLRQSVRIRYTPYKDARKRAIINIDSIVKGEGNAGLAFHAVLKTGGAMLGGALGARMFSNLSAATGAIIGSWSAVAELVTIAALQTFYPKWQKHFILQHLPNSVKFTVVATCLREAGVASFGPSFFIGVSIALVPVVLSVAIALAVLKRGNESQKESAV